jgi:uncharacterized membrane protein YbaN (DUF454 family)
LRKIFRLVAGVFLLVIGLLGLILPIMPGWIFIIPGLVILGEYFPPVQRLVHWARQKLENARTGTPPRAEPPVE